MNEKQFEDDGVEYINSYNYALLDTYYEFDGERIIEWNKHSSNAEYTDFERITEILNIKQMRLESLMKHREEVGKLLNRIDEQQATIESERDLFEKYKASAIRDMRDYSDKIIEMQKKVDEQQSTIEKQKRIIKSQDDEISRQYNLCLAMRGVLREEFGVYDVFDRTKDKKSGWDSEPNTDYITRVKEGLNDE